jgi:hypothetical protein
MKCNYRPIGLWLGVLLVVVHTSFGDAAGIVDFSAHKMRLELSEPPKDAAHVLTVQKLLVAAKKQAGAPATREVVVEGQIGGMPNVWPDTHPDFPWYDGQASFFLVDSKVAAQFAAHAKKHGGNHHCTFCQSLAAKNAHAVAVVNLVDKNGQTLRIDARELLNLKENQTVVIRGTAKLLGGRMLVIDAVGVYTQR